MNKYITFQQVSLCRYLAKPVFAYRNKLEIKVYVFYLNEIRCLYDIYFKFGTQFVLFVLNDPWFF